MFKKRNNTEITEGPLFINILLFTIPIMLTGILQLFYNMADNIIVGKYSGDPSALAQVGSTGALTNLLLNLLWGVSVGSGVLVAQGLGAKDNEKVSKTVHTSFLFALVGGFVFGIFGALVSGQLLELMDTKPDIIDGAALYMKIIFMGIPGSALFNFGAAMLRSAGDSKRPLIILAVTGLANVFLNLFFVIVLKISVAGVALATIISQYMSAIAVLYIFYKSNDSIKLNFSKLKIDGSTLKRMLRIGIPSGIQGCVFSFANVMIQSSVNQFSTEVVAGNTAGGSIDGFTYTVMNSFYHASLTYTGQNYGAKKYKRVYKVLGICLLQVSFCGILVGYTELHFARQLATLFVDMSLPNANLIVDAAVERLGVTLPFYFLCGMMECFSGHLRGLGYSTVPMISSVLGACVFRIAWIMFIFPMDRFHSPAGVYVSWPLSWGLTCIFHLTTELIIYHKMKKKFKTEQI